MDVKNGDARIPEKNTITPGRDVLHEAADRMAETLHTYASDNHLDYIDLVRRFAMFLEE